MLLAGYGANCVKIWSVKRETRANIMAPVDHIKVTTIAAHVTEDFEAGNVKSK